MLEKALAASNASEEEQMTIMKELERKETEYMRLKRHKISVDDFELLTIIGRGAFGEVLLLKLFQSPLLISIFLQISFLVSDSLKTNYCLKWCNVRRTTLNSYDFSEMAKI